MSSELCIFSLIQGVRGKSLEGTATYCAPCYVSLKRNSTLHPFLRH